MINMLANLKAVIFIYDFFCYCCCYVQFVNWQGFVEINLNLIFTNFF